MKKSYMMIVGLAGLANAAYGQHSFSLTLIPSASTIDTSGGMTTFEVEVIGDASVGTHILSGSFALQSNSDLIVDMSWTSASWDSFRIDGGYAGNGNYNQIIFWQYLSVGIPPFSEPAEDSILGSRIGTFSVTLAVDSMGAIDLSLVPQDPFTLEVLDNDSGPIYDDSEGELILNGASVSVVPAPSVIGLFSLSGLALSRRRR